MFSCFVGDKGNMQLLYLSYWYQIYTNVIIKFNRVDAFVHLYKLDEFEPMVSVCLQMYSFNRFL